MVVVGSLLGKGLEDVSLLGLELLRVLFAPYDFYRAVVAQHFAAAVGVVHVEQRALLAVELLALSAGIPFPLHVLHFLDSCEAALANVSGALLYPL